MQSHLPRSPISTGTVADCEASWDWKQCSYGCVVKDFGSCSTHIALHKVCCHICTNSRLDLQPWTISPHLRENDPCQRKKYHGFSLGQLETFRVLQQIFLWFFCQLCYFLCRLVAFVMTVGKTGWHFWLSPLPRTSLIFWVALLERSIFSVLAAERRHSVSVVSCRARFKKGRKQLKVCSFNFEWSGLAQIWCFMSFWGFHCYFPPHLFLCLTFWFYFS